MFQGYVCFHALRLHNLGEGGYVCLKRQSASLSVHSDLMKAIVQLQAALESSAQETRQLKAEVAVLRGSSSGPSGARAVLAGPGRSEREGNVLRV